MKKILVIVCATFLTAASYAFVPEVNEKVLKSFNETFKNAEEVKWEEFSSYYTVSFVHAGIRSKVNYDKEGTVIGSIRYYAPEMLPLNIYSKLKNKYSKKTLYGVTEITFGTDVNYFVKIHDDKSWYTVKVTATGDMEIHEKFKKADNE